MLEPFRHYARYVVNSAALALVILSSPEFGAVIPVDWLPTVVSATAALNTLLSWLRRIE